jgi:putative pyruvate formate lyase activating enzyme
MPNSLLSKCLICPRACGVDRHVQAGACGSGATLRVNCSQLHFWEEPVISGSRGSGTVFFSGCNLRCVYCQNYVISQEHRGSSCSVDELAERMLDLQGQGAHNINLVTPTHFTPLIRDSLVLAKGNGLTVPVVWNSNAYETVETLRSLTGLVDLYLPDFRYFDDTVGRTYSDAPGYPECAKSAILEMFRQVGHLRVVGGIATAGLLIRILVLPGNVNRADRILAWIAEALGNETYLSLMGQYYPTYHAAEHPEINRPVSHAEYGALEDLLEELGFDNGFVQEIGSSSDYTPDFR